MCVVSRVFSLETAKVEVRKSTKKGSPFINGRIHHHFHACTSLCDFEPAVCRANARKWVDNDVYNACRVLVYQINETQMLITMLASILLLLLLMFLFFSPLLSVVVGSAPQKKKIIIRRRKKKTLITTPICKCKPSRPECSFRIPPHIVAKTTATEKNDATLLR